MIDYAAILSAKYAGREWKLNGDEYENLEMLDGGNKPTKKELEALWPEVQAALQAQIDNREAAKISARNKLKGLGLSDDEIKALVG